MSDEIISPASHAAWLRSILADHRAIVSPTISPGFIMVCTTDSHLNYGQLVRASGNATQIEEGDRVEPCEDGTLPHGITTTDTEGNQTVTVIVGLYSEDGPIRGSLESGR